MNIPFSRPLIDDDVVREVNDSLTNTGWLTTGPKVVELEGEISKITGTPAVCVSSWTSGAMVMLRWFGVGPGDEVIVPAYTYAATALCAMNIGATVVMVDVRDDFTIDPEKVRAAITPRTKAIIPVDVAGWSADYRAIYEVIESPQARAMFVPTNDRQKQLGRILVVSDAAHSIGASYRGRPSGANADATVFSFQSVKNVTTGEGGAICVNLPDGFDNRAESVSLRVLALNGQTKSAFEKDRTGAWRYDIVAQGFKANMPDIGAAVGLAQIRKYSSELLPDRKHKFELYNEAFAADDWAILPRHKGEERESSCHLYMLRVAGISEAQRDQIIQTISDQGIGTNVHYLPMPMLTVFAQNGYDIGDYPMTHSRVIGQKEWMGFRSRRVAAGESRGCLTR